MSSPDDYDPKEKKVVEKAPPPWHAWVYVVIVMTTSIRQCQSTIHTIDEVAVLDTFTNRVFPEYISLLMLGWIRFAIAVSIWVVMVSTITSDGWIQTTNYPPHSKLQSGVKIAMKGSRTLFPFTSWCWILLGISFTCNSALALGVAYKGEEMVLPYIQSTPWILRSILMVWQTAAPCAFLVSSVIRYVIWDKVKNGPGDTKHLKHIRNMFSHNLNSVYVLLEVALLGGLPVRINEMYLGPIYGTVYVLMAWSLTGFWAEKRFGPHFIYFFLDTTVGYATTISLAALTATLSMFYVMLAYATVWLSSLTDYYIFTDFPQVLLACHVGFVVGLASLVCRMND